MSSLRFKAVEEAFKKKAAAVKVPSELTSEYFGKYVFTRSTMARFLSEQTIKEIDEAIEKGTTLDRSIADKVAEGMKKWAMELGATHYTHWFQPLTDKTAEKHDSFIDYLDDKPGENVIEKFSGSCWHSRNLMLLLSRVEESEARLKPVVIRLGILHRLHLLLMIHCVFLPFLFHIPENRSIIKLLC
jgi:hypothetical protein